MYLINHVSGRKNTEQIEKKSHYNTWSIIYYRLGIIPHNYNYCTLDTEEGGSQNQCCLYSVSKYRQANYYQVTTKATVTDCTIQSSDR